VDTEPLSFEAADGVRLSADLRLPATPAQAVVVACHPHPLYGGDRHNVVPATLSSALVTRGYAVLRFDFRGAGDSAGWHGAGVAERLDLSAAVDAAVTAVPDVPLVIAGYSFGADVSLSVDHPAIAGWCAIAPPLAIFDDPAAYVAGADPRPKVIASPAHDQFCPPALAAERTAAWTATQVVAIPMADHFLAGATLAVVDLVADTTAALT
jgi:uncharacterized protein